MRLLIIILFVLSSCTQKPSQAFGVLLDTSGTYMDQSEEILQQIRLVILPTLSADDQLILMKIDSYSYGWENILAIIKIPKGRMEANNDKRLFSEKIGKLELKSSRFTDISGALLYCSEYMHNLNTKNNKIMIFSDMKEELPNNVSRVFRRKEFNGIDIAVVNTKRLFGDQIDPEKYRGRMDSWKSSLIQHGAASFQVFMGTDKIKTFMEK